MNVPAIIYVDHLMVDKTRFLAVNIALETTINPIPYIILNGNLQLYSYSSILSTPSKSWRGLEGRL